MTMQHPTRKAHRKTVLERCEQIHAEMQADRRAKWLREEMIRQLEIKLIQDMDQCTEVYQ